MDIKDVEAVVNQLEKEKEMSRAFSSLKPLEKKKLLENVNAERRRIGMDTTASDEAIKELSIPSKR